MERGYRNSEPGNKLPAVALQERIMYSTVKYTLIPTTGVTEEIQGRCGQSLEKASSV